MATKVFKTLRTHWKKSIFASAAFVYGLKLARNKYEETNLMRDYCKRAALYGQQMTNSASQKPYHVTVILNPAANHGKGRKQFEKYCAPILHLAGMKVSVIRTEGIGQAKEIMKIMDDTDAVLIAGGDGTLMEAMTGLLRRQDSNLLCQTVPVGVLPIGVKNHMAKNLFPDMPSSSSVALMAEAAMSVVEQFFKPVDVLEVKSLNDPEVHPLYGLRQVRAGVFDGFASRKDKYWYWAALKQYMAYTFAFTTSKDAISWKIPSSIQIGNLVHEEIVAAGDDEKPKSSWWSWLVPSSSSSLRSSNKTFKTTAEWTEEFDYSGCELTIESSGNNFPHKDDSFEGKMTLSLGPNEMSFAEFVREGWRREQQLLDTVPESWLKRSNCQTFLWHPDLEALKKNMKNPEEDKYFYLDGESVEILGGPLQISCIPQKVVMFCSQAISQRNQQQTSTPVKTNKRWYLNQHQPTLPKISTSFQ